MYSHLSHPFFTLIAYDKFNFRFPFRKSTDRFVITEE